MSGAYQLDRYGIVFSSAAESTVVSALTFKAPAAGSDWTITVPDGVVWLPVSVSATFSTSNAVSTRTPQFTMAFMGSTFFNAGAINQLTATNLATFTLATDIGYSAAQGGGAQQLIGMPVVVLPAGATISSTTVNIQAGDQWSAQSIYVRSVVLHGADTSAQAPPEPLVATPIVL